MKTPKCKNKKKCCKTCFWSYENSDYACGTLKSSLTGWNLPNNAEKYCCFQWEPFILKKHYCCDAEIAYTNEDRNIEKIIMIIAESKSQYKKDLIKLNNKYGNRVIRLTNYKEIQLKKAITKKQ